MGKTQRMMGALLVATTAWSLAETVESGGYKLLNLAVTPKVETLTLRQYAQRFYQAPWWLETYVEWPCSLLKADGRITGGSACDLLCVEVDAVEETSKEKRTVTCYVTVRGSHHTAVLTGESDITPLPVGSALVGSPWGQAQLAGGTAIVTQASIDRTAWERTSWSIATVRVSQASAVALPPGRTRLLAPLAGLYSYSVLPTAPTLATVTNNVGQQAPAAPQQPGALRKSDGFVTLPDGTRYRGQMTDGKPNGKGYMEWPNRQKYQGDFVNGIMQGTGTLFYANGGVYQGAMMCNVRWGAGRMYFPSEDVYQGEFSYDLMQGFGIYMYKDNSVYRGQFAQGTCSGTGTLYQADRTLYQGEFLNGLPNGRGQYQLPGGSVYVGDVKDGTCEGRGQFVWPDNKVYEGAFRAGKRSGRGTMTWPDGTSFTGEFVNDVATGRGLWRNPDGSTYEADASEVGPGGKRLTIQEAPKGRDKPASKTQKTSTPRKQPTRP